MKALIIQNGFGLENLALSERPDPTPGPGQVLVRVRAASLNYRDLLIVRGQYNPKLKMPRILGSDAAGEVVAVGSGVTKFKPGDRVVGCFMQHWESGPITEAVAKSTLGSRARRRLRRTGRLRGRRRLAAAGQLELRGSGDAAVCGGHGLERADRRPVRAGQDRASPGHRRRLDLRPAIGQGAGGEGAHHLQPRREAGPAQALGADAGTNYKTNPDWDKWARERPAAPAWTSWSKSAGRVPCERSAKAVRYGGHIALIGVLSGVGSFNPMPVLMKSRSRAGRVRRLAGDVRGDEPADRAEAASSR